MRKFVWVALILAGCSKVGGGGDTKFLIPWRTESGQYELQEVTISTLASPEELRGAAAEVFYRTGFTRDGYQGGIARPHLMKSGDTYIPLDAESAMAVAVYAQFDRLYFYERQNQTFSQIAWPRKVGIDLNMVGPDGSSHNNAHYFTELDIIGLLPYSKARGVPVAVNHGIVAHEHFHAHFESQVMRPLNRIPQIFVSSLENMFYQAFPLQSAVVNPPAEGRSIRALNAVVLRAWNEGLADLAAGLYTGQADFFTPSLAEHAFSRVLNADSLPFAPASALRDIQFADKKVENEVKMNLAYRQGTNLARLLYRISKKGFETPEAFSRRIHRQLSKIPGSIAGDINSKLLEFERIVPILLQDFPLDRQTCMDLAGTVSPDMMSRSFAKCAR